MGFDRRAFKHGQIVRDSAGRRLGIIYVCGDERLYLVEHGWMHHKYAARYDQVAGIENGDVKLKAGADTLEDLGEGPVPEKPITFTKPIYPPAMFPHG